MRARLALRLLSGAAAVQASAGDSPNLRSHGPIYNADALSQLEFQSIHLDLEQREACAH